MDRIEAALELIIGEHEQFRAEHRMLLKSQVLMQDTMERGFQQFRQEMDEITDKLNGLIGAVDQAHRDFESRLRRLEGPA
ncbi:MAG: hypothetical protein ACKV22_38195 [Bryobacteraceae bacterium]